MDRRLLVILLGGLFLIAHSSFAQPKQRITFNNQQLFIDGLNIAWVNYSNDVGSTIPTDTAAFSTIFEQVHSAGGNTVRWWIHNDGTSSPLFSTGDSTVAGPGAHTLTDMKKVLDLAWENGVGVDICLWAFNMLNKSNSSLVLERNQKLLNDTNATRAYINNCLVPMVKALKGHPGIVAWEIFNEPEGMSIEFGWSAVNHVPMSVIQRFINLCAAAIHRTDPSTKVTSGANNFYSLTDNTIAKAAVLPKLSAVEKVKLEVFIQQKYHFSLSADEIIRHAEDIANNTSIQQNYYRDDRLISAGGDTAGVLDFYSVHYYSNASSSNPTGVSPFHHLAVSWGLNKSILVAEFAMEDGYYNPPSIPKSALYDTLYQLGYGGGMAWSWTDIQISSREDMLADIHSVWKNHTADIAVNKIVYDWPTIAITSPMTGTNFPDSTSMSFTAMVIDTLPISSVAFYNDTSLLGTIATPASVSKDTSWYLYRWNTLLPGSYKIKAVATNSRSHATVSKLVSISIGKPTMVRLEAETAMLTGTGFSTKSDPTASGGSYLDMRTSDTTSKVTWYVYNLAPAGNYDIAFGYELAYNIPKTQYINVNGSRIAELTFDGTSTTTWYEKTITVPLVHGINSIQMQMYWGWMYLDYLAVPKIVMTSVLENPSIPTQFALEQNYPNPFNPSTMIHFSIPYSSPIKVTVFNLLGQQVATIADKVMEAGVYTIKFDAAQLASGVYFYRLEAGKFISQKKMLLLR